MDKSQSNTFIPVTDNRIINEKAITWVKRMDECLYICTSSNGCGLSADHVLCKYRHPESYAKLNEKWFSSQEK
jgi:hypothetical protein